MQQLLSTLGDFCTHNGLVVSAGPKGKSEILIHGFQEKGWPTPRFSCQGKFLPTTTDYKYLG